MIDRRGLLKTAVLVYAVLTVVALAIAWLAKVDLRPLLQFDAVQAAIGLAAVVPMSIVFFVAPDLKDRVVDLLGPALAECRMVDLVLLAAMAGVSEELVFRGALEGWLLRYDVVAAVVVTNLAFGLMHPITVTYFLMAAGFGVYFSVLANLAPERNLTAPIVAHAVYDFIGFLLVARDYRQGPPDAVRGL
ncbi:MAG TPA: CPBP family intramembrane glutamic endopeptidase [Caulifigura sp.]|nr:CPBP family intramembrane glutamic endopeptidase [Caulifigura sp.]